MRFMQSALSCRLTSRLAKTALLVKSGTPARRTGLLIGDATNQDRIPHHCPTSDSAILHRFFDLGGTID